MVKGTARQEEEFLLTNIILFEHHCQAGGTPNYASAGPVKRGAKNNPPPQHQQHQPMDTPTNRSILPPNHPSCTAAIQQYVVPGTAVKHSTPPKNSSTNNPEPTMCVPQYIISTRSYAAQQKNIKLKSRQVDLNPRTAEKKVKKKQKEAKEHGKGDLN